MRLGFCGETGALVRGDCQRGHKGSFGLPTGLRWDSAKAFCDAACANCARCAFVSLALKWNDCSWFASCDLGMLRRDVGGFRSYQFRLAPAAIPPPPTIVREAGQRTRVAVCLTGHPRSFVRRHVHTSIQRQLLGGLRGHGAQVDVFAVLGLVDAPSKPNSAWRFSRMDSGEKETWRAIGHLRPRSVLRVPLDWGPAQVNQRCGNAQMANGLGKAVSPQSWYARRLVPQIAAWATCHEEVQRAEHHDGVPYDFVVRSRPDVWWHAPHPPLCDASSPHNCTRGAWLHQLRCSEQPGFPDQHFVLPRPLVHVLRDLLDQYRGCNGPFPYNSLEDWLMTNVQYAAEELSLPKMRRISFPFVVVRNSSTEASASLFCCPRQAHDSRAHKRCMRGAYPSDEGRGEAMWDHERLHGRQLADVEEGGKGALLATVPRHWSTGHCGVTESRSCNDRSASQGSFPLVNYSRAACIAKCRACPRCRYISFSAENKDCSFYRWCDLEHLYTGLYGGSTFVSAAVRKPKRSLMRLVRQQPPHRNCTSPQRNGPARAAFVTIVCNSTGRGAHLGSYYAGHDQITPWDNVRQAVALGRSLPGEGLERVALTRGLSDEASDVLRSNGWDVIDASGVPNSAFVLRRIEKSDATRHWPRSGRVQQRSDNECTSLKLLAWNLTEYSRLMVSDTDVCMRQDPLPWMRRHWSEYFVMGQEGRFGNMQRGYVGLNSHLFFLQPSTLLFRVLTDMATSGSFVPFTNGDQDVIETVFAPHAPRPELPTNLHAKARNCEPLHQPRVGCVPAYGTFSSWEDRQSVSPVY